jgi:hypothetical protein
VYINISPLLYRQPSYPAMASLPVPFDEKEKLDEVTQKRPGITSTVILNPQDWADMSFLIPHEAIRTMQNNMAAALKHIKPQKSDAWKLKRWFQFYEEVFFVFIHHHHTSEDEMVLPVILERSGEDHKDLTDDHHKLIGSMKLIESIAKEFKKNHANYHEQDIVQVLAVLNSDFPALKEQMEEHLAEEERIFPAFLRKHYSEAEMKVLEGKILQSIGDHLNVVWGAVIEPMKVWTTPDELNWFLNGIPWVPKQLAYYAWEPHYRWTMENTLESITAGHIEEPLLVASRECIIL